MFTYELEELPFYRLYYIYIPLHNKDVGTVHLQCWFNAGNPIECLWEWGRNRLSDCIPNA